MQDQDKNSNMNMHQVGWYLWLQTWMVFPG